MIFYQMLYGKKPFGEDQSQEMCAPHPTDFPHFSFQDVLFCSSKDADDAVAVFARGDAASRGKLTFVQVRGIFWGWRCGRRPP